MASSCRKTRERGTPPQHSAARDHNGIAAAGTFSDAAAEPRHTSCPTAAAAATAAAATDAGGGDTDLFTSTAARRDAGAAAAAAAPAVGCVSSWWGRGRGTRWTRKSR